jgi:hypothetical protein
MGILSVGAVLPLGDLDVLNNGGTLISNVVSLVTNPDYFKYLIFI